PSGRTDFFARSRGPSFSILPLGTKYAGSTKYPTAQAMRVAKVSAFTSEPNLAVQVAPFASLTRTLGLLPFRLSSTKTKGGLGDPIRPPAPEAKSSLSTAPGSAQITGLPGWWEAFCFCAVTDVMKTSASVAAISGAILRMFKVMTVLLAIFFLGERGR